MLIHARERVVHDVDADDGEDEDRATLIRSQSDRSPACAALRMRSMLRQQHAVTGSRVLADDVAARITRQSATTRRGPSACLISDRQRRATTDGLMRASSGGCTITSSTRDLDARHPRGYFS